jgi:hypothetical protein
MRVLPSYACSENFTGRPAAPPFPAVCGRLRGEGTGGKRAGGSKLPSVQPEVGDVAGVLF